MSTSNLEKGNSFLTAYLEANKKLIQTLVIKSDISAFLINESIKKKYGDISVDIYSPETWKYYLNLSGQPHFTDVYMNVISLDTLEVIEFTPENLKVHTATARAYKFGTRYYYSLLRKYPTQEAYIMGILNPVDIYDAIQAENGSILAYDESLVEEQEKTLIEDLETYIKNYFSRWTVPGYQTTDEYYSFGLYFVIAVHCYNRLLNLRQIRCHTNEAHSFHIREYLASHGRLDRYIPYLTLYQKLYLYRNIRYIEHHSGSVEQFRELTNEILSIRKIPLAEYSINQIDSFDDQNYINILAKKKELGTSANVTTKEYVEVAATQNKIKPSVYGNEVYLESNAENEIRRFRTSNSSVIRTKTLESTMIDYTESVPDTMVEILFRQWAHMSRNDLYTALIYYTDPMTGDYRSLDAKDAFIYFTYLNLCSMGIFVDKVPSYTNVKFRKTPLPSLDELLKLIPKDMEDLIPVATDLLEKQPAITECKSVYSFSDVCRKLYEESNRHWHLTSSISDMYRLSIVRQMVLKLYGMEWVVPTEQEPIDVWLTNRKLPVYNYTWNQAKQLMETLFVASTGYKVNDYTQLKFIQKNLLQLFGQLSSYTVQFLSEVNEEEIIPLNWAAIRLGNIKENVYIFSVVYNGVSVLENRGEVKSQIRFKGNAEPFVYKVRVSALDKINIKSKLTVTTKQSLRENQPVYIEAIRYNASYPGMDPATSNKASYIGAEFFESLTEDQRKQIKSF